MHGPITRSPAVLLLGFRRAEHFRCALAQVRLAAPQQLFVALDGPRPEHPGDVEACAATARVLREIDWPCQMNLLRRSANLGCRVAVSSAITWAFQHVEELIIIEEDCVLEPGFFAFAQELLQRHRDDERVGVIAAANFQQGKRRGEGDYYASKYPHCWGWATWRRSWKHYSDELPPVEQIACPSLHRDEREQAYWRLIHQRCEKGSVDSWAYRWTFSCWLKRMITLLPNVNLVTNIGFDVAATHTSGDSPLSPVQSPPLECRSPATLEVDEHADQWTFDHVFCPAGSPDASKLASVSKKRTPSTIEPEQTTRSWWQLWV